MARKGKIEIGASVTVGAKEDGSLSKIEKRIEKLSNEEIEINIKDATKHLAELEKMEKMLGEKMAGAIEAQKKQFTDLIEQCKQEQKLRANNLKQLEQEVKVAKELQKIEEKRVKAKEKKNNEPTKREKELADIAKSVKSIRGVANAFDDPSIQKTEEKVRKLISALDEYQTKLDAMKRLRKGNERTMYDTAKSEIADLKRALGAIQAVKNQTPSIKPKIEKKEKEVEQEKPKKTTTQQPKVPIVGAGDSAKSIQDQTAKIKQQAGAMESLGKSAEKAAKQVGSIFDPVKQKKYTDYINGQIKDTERSIQNQQDWIRHLGWVFDDGRFASSGKKDAYDKLKLAAMRYNDASRRKTAGTSISEDEIELATIAWKKAYDEAVKQGVAERRLYDYKPPMWNYDSSLQRVQGDYDYRKKTLERDEVQLTSLKQIQENIEGFAQLCDVLGEYRQCIKDINGDDKALAESAAQKLDSVKKNLSTGIDIKDLDKQNALLDIRKKLRADGYSIEQIATDYISRIGFFGGRVNKESETFAQEQETAAIRANTKAVEENAKAKQKASGQKLRGLSEGDKEVLIKLFNDKSFQERQGKKFDPIEELSLRTSMATFKRLRPRVKDIMNNAVSQLGLEDFNDIVRHYLNDEILANSGTLLFTLFEDYFQQGFKQFSLSDFMKDNNIIPELRNDIVKMLNGLSINYSDFINYAGTLDLETINLRVPEIQQVTQQQEQLTTTVEENIAGVQKLQTLLSDLKKKYGEGGFEYFADTISSFGTLNASNAIGLYDALIEKEKEYVAHLEEERQKRAAITQEVQSFMANPKVQDILFKNQNNEDFIQGTYAGIFEKITQGALTADEAVRKLEESLKILSAPKDIVYHAGDLSNIDKTIKSLTLGHVKPQLSGGVYQGKYQPGSIFNGLTGLYTTEDLDSFIGNEWTGAPISSIDISKYKLFKPGSNEIATRVMDFFDELNGTIYGYLEYFDMDQPEMQVRTDVKPIGELYSEMQAIFGQVNVTVEEFTKWVNDSKAAIKGYKFVGREQPVLDEGISKIGYGTVLDGAPESLINADSFQTQLMKMLGFEGIDLRGTKYNGTYTGGTVIFDIKPESLKAVNEKYSDVMVRNGLYSAEEAKELVEFEEKRRQLAFETAKAFSKQEEIFDRIVDAQEKPNNKFREYNDLVAIGYDRLQKLQKIRESGTAGLYATEDLLRANRTVWDKTKENNFFNNVPEDGFQRVTKIGEVTKSVVAEILESINLTEEQLISQLSNVRNAVGGNFRPNGYDSGWNHFATYDANGNKHLVQKDNGITYKVYAAFENIEDLNADIVSSIMEELTKAGFEGRLKTTSGSASLTDKLNRITSTDQLVIHGSSKKDQEIAYNVLRNLKTPLSYLSGGIDTPDGSFTQTLASGNIGKYVKVQQSVNDSSNEQVEIAEQQLEIEQNITEEKKKQKELNDSFTPYRITGDEAREIIRSKISEADLQGWYYGSGDYTKREKISELAMSDNELRNAGLNLLYDQYSLFGKKMMSFADFMNSEFTVFRGTSKQKEQRDSSSKFTSFSFDEEKARKFLPLQNDNQNDPWLISHKTKIKDTLGYFGERPSEEMELIIPKSQVDVLQNIGKSTIDVISTQKELAQATQTVGESAKQAATQIEQQADADANLIDISKKINEQESKPTQVSNDIINKLTKGANIEQLLSKYGIPSNKFDTGVDLFKDLAGALYQEGGSAGGEKVNEAFVQLAEFIEKNAERTEQVDKTLENFYNYMSQVQIRIPENMEKAFEAENPDDWKRIKKLYSIGGNYQNKKRLITTSKYASTPDVLLEELLANGFEYALGVDKSFNGSAQDSLRLILDAVQRAKGEAKLGKTQKIIGLDVEAQAAMYTDLSEAASVVEQNYKALSAATGVVNVGNNSVIESAEQTGEALKNQARSAEDAVKAMEDLQNQEQTDEKSVFPAEKVETEIDRIRKAIHSSEIGLDQIADTEGLQAAVAAYVKSLDEIDDKKFKLISADINEVAEGVDRVTLKFQSLEDENVKLAQTWAMNDGELTLGRLRTTKTFVDSESNFDTELERTVANSKIDALESQLIGIDHVSQKVTDSLTSLRTAAGNISSNSDIKTFAKNFQVAQNYIKEFKNEYKTLGSLANETQNAQAKMANAQETINAQISSSAKYIGVDGYDKVTQSIDNMTSALSKYNEAQQKISDGGLDTEAIGKYEKQMADAFTEYNKAEKQLGAAMKEVRANASFDTFSKSMKDAETVIDTAKLKLDKFGELDGVEKANGYIDEMTAAWKKFNDADSTIEDKAQAVKDFTSANESFTKQVQYLNEVQKNTPKESPVNKIQTYYERYINAVKTLNDVDQQLYTYQGKNESGAYNGFIEQLQEQKTRILAELQDINSSVQEEVLNIYDPISLDGDKYKFDLSRYLDADTASTIKEFFNNASVEAELGAESIQKFIDVAMKSSKIDAAFAEGIGKQLKSINDLHESTKEFADTNAEQIFKSIQAGFAAKLTSGTDWTQEQENRLRSLIETYTEYATVIDKAAQKERKILNSVDGKNILRGDSLDPTKDMYDQMVEQAEKMRQATGATAVSIGDFDEATGRLTFTLDGVDGKARTFTMSMTELGHVAVAQVKNIDKVKTGWDEFKGSLGGVGKQLLQYGLRMVEIYDIIRYLRQGFNEVLQIDTAMTELKKVTDETAVAYDNFAKSAYASSKKIGSTMKEFIQATADFARLGYSLEEASQLAEAANVYKNVGDGINDVAQASESIISTMKAFNIEATDSMGIVDKFNEIKITCLHMW